MLEHDARRIAIVTEELAFGKGGGGIGAAIHELALALRRTGHSVDLIYLPIDQNLEKYNAIVNYYGDRDISVIDPDIGRFVWPPFSYERRSYALFRHLIDIEQPYDFIHFHDYKGLGFHSLVAKSQCVGFPNTKIVVQLHGPTRWAIQANDHPFTHEDQLKVDFMERESIARADLLVSPSRYMVEWLHQNGWTTPPAERVRVIQNICSHLVETMRSVSSRAEQTPANEIIFFGRHEERKGIVEFCDALDVIQTALAHANILITFLGGFGTIHGEDSAIYLSGRSSKWTFPIRLLPDCDRTAASKYIAANNRSVVVVPSRVENSPYTVLETAILGKPLVTSAAGGSPELLDPALVPVLTCAIDRDSLAAKLLEAVRTGLPPARLAVAPATTERQWLDLHAGSQVLSRFGKQRRNLCRPRERRRKW